MATDTIIFTSNGRAPGKTLLCVSVLTYIFRTYEHQNVQQAQRKPVIVIDANEDNTSIYAWLRDLRLPYTPQDNDYDIQLSNRQYKFEYYRIGDKVVVLRPKAQSDFHRNQVLEFVSALHSPNAPMFGTIRPDTAGTFLVDTGGALSAFANTDQTYPPQFPSVLHPWIVWTHEAFKLLRDYAIEKTKGAATLVTSRIPQNRFTEENIVHVFNPLLVATSKHYQEFGDRTFIERITDFARDQLGAAQSTVDGFFGGVEIGNFSVYANSYLTNGQRLDLQDFFDGINPSVFDRYAKDWAVADPKQNYEMVGQILCDNFTRNNLRFDNIVAIPWYRYHLAVLRDIERAWELFIGEIAKEQDADARVRKIGDVLGLYYTPLEKRYYPHLINWL